jgi:hypothetical protein
MLVLLLLNDLLERTRQLVRTRLALGSLLMVTPSFALAR